MSTLLTAEDSQALDVTLDLAAVLTTFLWVALAAFVFWRYREPLSEFLKELPRRVKSITAAGISVNLAEADSRPLLARDNVAVDLRHAGTPTDVNDSTLRSFYAQIEDTTPLEHAVVDLGSGSEWLSSRLFILAVILRRMRGLDAFVIVEAVQNERRRFVGICDSEKLRWRLAARWPRFESALAAAQMHVWGHPYDDTNELQIPFGMDPNNPAVPLAAPPFRNWAAIANDEGRITLKDWPSPEPAATLLRAFLTAIQRPPPQFPPEEWQSLSSPVQVVEYAVWLNGRMMGEVLRDSLNPRSIKLSDWQTWSNEVRTRAVIEADGHWVAVTRDDGIFDRLINRRALVEDVAEQMAAE
jgi:hypothetical protein